MSTATLVAMPRLSDSMEEGTIISWLKANGDLVAVGDPLVEVETDKAVMTYEAEAAGVLRQLAAEGDSVVLGGPLAELLPEGSPVDDAPAPAPAAPAAADPAAATTNGASTDSSRAGGDISSGAATSAADAKTNGSGRIAASPVARRLARLHDIDLAALAGTGPRGRVVKRDVEAAAGAAPKPAPQVEPTAAVQASSPHQPVTSAGTAKGETELLELTRIQATVARRMSESRATVPDISVEIDVDADALVELRATLRERMPDTRIPSYNDFVVKACALALREHPTVNGAYRDGHLEHYSRVNVGVAVATDDALLVPVIDDADVKSVGAISRETRDLAGRARAGTITAPDLSGGTFTVSNLGMFGVARFSAVINMPQSAILAVGALRREPVVRGDDVRPGHVMSLTLCADHRAIYGADAARFLADVRVALEEPLRLLI